MTPWQDALSRTSCPCCARRWPDYLSNLCLPKLEDWLLYSVREEQARLLLNHAFAWVTPAIFIILVVPFSSKWLGFGRGQKRFTKNTVCATPTVVVLILLKIDWGVFLKPQPPHTRQKYEQKYGPQTAKFALFWSIWGHVLSRCLFIFLPCMWGAGVTSAFEKLAAEYSASMPGMHKIPPWAQNFTH